MASPDGPLGGRVVLLTRPAGRSATLQHRLEALGARVAARPTIALDPPQDPEPARRSIADLERFDWVLFTSTNGVRFFFRLFREVRGTVETIPSRIGAIGPATARELERRGFPASLVASDNCSEGLAAALRGRIEAGHQVLIVRPEKGLPVLAGALAEHGAIVESVAFYRNVAAADLDDVAKEICERSFDVVVFTSPSTFSRLLEARSCPRNRLLAALARTALVSIGKTTAEALERAALRPAAIAAEPSDRGILRAIRSVLEP